MIRDHLLSRHYDLSLHSTLLSEDQTEAYFLLWNLSGQCVGYQKYNPSYTKNQKNDPKLSKYYTWKTKPDDKNAHTGFWGLESWSFTNTLFVCEGVFDAARLTNLGVSAIATLSNDLSKGLKNQFRLFRAMRPVVVICDDDLAGSKLAKAGHVSYIVETGKDLGEASESEIDFILDRFLT
jgi:hypothetical protein